jgi:ATP-binding cassette subfamily B protein
LARTYYYQVLRYVVDELLNGSESMSNLPWIALIFVGLAALEGTFAYFRAIGRQRCRKALHCGCATTCTTTSNACRFAFHDYAKTGELILRVTSDVDALRRFYADQALGIGRNHLALFFINFTMMMQMNPRLAWLLSSRCRLIVAMSDWFFGASPSLRPLPGSGSQALDDAPENLTGVRVVRASPGRTTRWTNSTARTGRSTGAARSCS